MKSYLFPGVLLLALPLSSGAESTQQQQYLEQVRTGLSNQLAGSSWRTTCYTDSHGLGAVTQLDFLADEKVTLTTRRYYDSNCQDPADWEASTRIQLKPTGEAPGGADLVSTEEGMMLRVRGPRIHLERKTWTDDLTFTPHDGES